MIVNASSIVHAVQIKHGIIKCQCECKKYMCKQKLWSESLQMYCENGKYLKSINDNLKIVCDGIMYVVNNVPPNVSKNILMIKKVRHKLDCYIVQIVLLVIILLFIMAIICYHQYEKQRSKLKKKNFYGE